MNEKVGNIDATCEVEMRKAHLSDIDEIVQIHRTSFPEYFLTNMGTGILRRYYTVYVTHPDAVAVVATVGENVCAFIVGTSKASSLLKTFYKDNFFYVLGVTFIKIVSLNPVVLKGLSMRLCHVRIAVQSYFAQKKKPALADAPESPESEVRVGRAVAAATLPEYRGKSVSREVFHQFEVQLKAHGASEVQLCVIADNMRAIRFYEKCGWTMVKDKGAELVFSKKL